MFVINNTKRLIFSMQPKGMMTYEKMMQLLSEDNNSAFDMFYHLYYSDVYKFAYFFLQNHETCKELVSDVFFSIWQSRKRMNEVANIKNYLFIATRNEAVRYNKNKQYDFVPLDEIAHQDGYNLSKSADEDLLSEEVDRLLEQTIRQLPERCRLVFTLIRQENMKYTEVAELLSLKESTVRVQMKIAIEKIAATMKPHFPNLELVVLVLLMLNKTV